MAARAFASATVSFGLVSIPVKIYTTRRTRSSLSFHLLHDTCGTRLERQYVCPAHGEVVSREHITRGYELARGQHVRLSDHELDAARAESDYAIALTEFVPAHTIDPIYLGTAYYLAPIRGGERAYRLLGQAMRRTDLVGVARYATRGKHHVVLLRPYGDEGLIMHPLRYQDEIRAFTDLSLRASDTPGDAEIDLAVQLVEQIATEAFHPERYVDEVKERVLALVQEKAAAEEQAGIPGTVRDSEIDLVGALEASLAMSGMHGAASHP